MKYENDIIVPQRVNFTYPDVLHILVKTLVSNYFHTHETFVSNTDFFLPVANLDSDFITVLKIRINQNWNNRNEFFFKDEAKVLRKLQDIEMDRFWSNTNYYGVNYDQNNNPTFKQLRYDSIRLRQKRQGIYVLPRRHKNRAQVTYHSVKSLEDLRESRSYILNKFFRGLLDYLNQLGLPFKHKELDMWNIDALKGKEMQKPQISIGDKSIYIVDDRMRPHIRPELETNNFADVFCTTTQSLLTEMKEESQGEIFDGKIPALNTGTAAQLPAGSYVLRIQDNEEGDFKNTYKTDPITKEEIIAEFALFKGYEDPLPKFYKAHPKLVIQTLSINDNTIARNKQQKRKKKSTPQVIWDLSNYLDYGQPNLDDNFRYKLEVSLNQLILKDVVMHPQNAQTLLPEEQLKIITNKVFMYLESLMYFDGTNLTFMPVSGNSSQAQQIIKDVTNKNLRLDVLKLAMEWYDKYQFSEEDIEDDDKVSGTLKKGRFIITEDYVWQIVDSPERMLYPDHEIESRLENLAEQRPIKDFYPKFPLTGDEPFNEQQLREYEAFLKEYVDERYISYDELKDKYGYIKERDDKGKLVRMQQGIYPIFGIKNDAKLKRYFQDFLNLPFESVRSDDVMSVYQGIWYVPQTHQYLVGDKDSRKPDQEKGFVLREILIHQGTFDGEQLFNTLNTDFFPMLQANFIRHKQYTVYPFPFNLIEIWNKIRVTN
ncbi:MAG: hypothetical protein FOGNACKC_00750 [Anaerolineae bacterium]|nr:hypothetical protein [Anaerolineae bacterium]